MPHYVTIGGSEEYTGSGKRNNNNWNINVLWIMIAYK